MEVTRFFVWSRKLSSQEKSSVVWILSFLQISVNSIWPCVPWRDRYWHLRSCSKDGLFFIIFEWLLYKCVFFIWLTYATLWDLSLFVLVGPLKMPFQPIRNIPAYTLTRTVTFLVAIASAKLPILVLLKEQAMLRILSKVVLVFYF